MKPLSTLGLVCLLFVFLGCSSANKSAESKQGQEATTGSVKAFPIVDSQKTISKIQFGSCIDQKLPQPIWNVMAFAEPELFIAMGDNVYLSEQDKPDFRAVYQTQSQVEAFQNYATKIPILATWDDNDYGQRDGGSNYTLKEDSQKAFADFFSASGTLIKPGQKGVYHSVVLGDTDKSVQVILLDTRYFRSDLEKKQNPKDPLDIYQPTQDRSKTILGEEQWQWLESEFKKPARVRILVSSIQVLHEKHGFEKWANFPHEKKRLLDLIKKNQLKNVILLSGDRHQSEIHKIKIPGYSERWGELYEFTSSGINKAATNLTQSEATPTRVGKILRDFGYGEIELNWDKKLIKVSLKNKVGHAEMAQELKIR
jgi:alkaline phosphatase D